MLTVPTHNLRTSRLASGLNPIPRYWSVSLRFRVGATQCARLSSFIGARRGLAGRQCTPTVLCPVSTTLIPTVTHPPHNFIDSSTIAISRHVPDSGSNRSFLTLPNYLPGCGEILPKADQDRHPHPSNCLPVAILQLYFRHNCHTSGSSTRI